MKTKMIMFLGLILCAAVYAQVETSGKNEKDKKVRQIPVFNHTFVLTPGWSIIIDSDKNSTKDILVEVDGKKRFGSGKEMDLYFSTIPAKDVAHAEFWFRSGTKSR